MGKARSSRWQVLRSAAQFLIGAAVGGFGAVLLLRSISDRLPDLDFGVVGAAVVASGSLVVLHLVVALHEAGHLLGGRLVGFRAVLFVVGPLKLERRGDGWTFGFNRNPRLYGGLAASVPDDRTNLRQRMLGYVAGGPVLSFVGGVLGLLLWLGVASGSTGTDVPGLEDYASIWLLLFGVGSSLIGLLTLLPGETSGFDTDGRRITRLLRGGPEAHGEVALMALIAQSWGGRRPAAWDGALVEEALRLDADTSIGLSARQMAYAYAMDRQEIDEGRRYLEDALARRDTLSQLDRASLYLQAAHFAAVHDRDAHSARNWLRQVKAGVLISPHERSLAEAAVSYAEGRRSDAATLLERAAGELSEALDAGSAQAAADRISELKDAVRTAASDRSSSTVPP